MQLDTLNIIIARWIQWMKTEKHYSTNTITAYSTDFSKFLVFLKEYLNTDISISILHELTYQTVRAWLASLKMKDYQTVSYARYLAAVKNFFHYLHKFENITNFNIKNIRVKKYKKTLPKALALSDTQATLNQALKLSKNPWIQLRDYALITLIYGCGLRISEALSVKLADLNGEYLSVLGKGNKARSIPILKEVKLAIEKYLELCPYKFTDKSNIFVGIRGQPLNPGVFQRQIRKIRINLGLPDSITPHSFRHSFATDLLSGGADLRSIQELLGHKNLSTTQIYTALDVKKILDTYSKTHPRS